MNILSTILLVLYLGFIVYTFYSREKIMYWGRRTLLLALFGLFICCIVATRDNYHLSVQASFDATIKMGLFAIDSMQSTICSICGGIIVISSFGCFFVKNQKYRKAVFFTVALVSIVKILVIEVSRMVIM